MKRDFEIQRSIYIVQPPFTLDLHNDFEFTGFEYSVERREVLLSWRRRADEWVPAGSPASVRVAFSEVSEFRFLPRDAELPFTEDDCLSTWGYWAEDRVVDLAPGQTPDPQWAAAIEFMSDAVIVVRAGSARAQIETAHPIP